MLYAYSGEFKDIILDLPHGHGGTLCILSSGNSVSIVNRVLHCLHLNIYLFILIYSSQLVLY